MYCQIPGELDVVQVSEELVGDYCTYSIVFPGFENHKYRIHRQFSYNLAHRRTNWGGWGAAPTV